MSDRYINAWAAKKPKEPLERIQLTPSPLGNREVKVAITHVGMCHSDLHLIDGDWGDASVYPQVCGHEIIGKVVEKGSDVRGLELGQRVGIGWQAGSCHVCDCCVGGSEQLCASIVATCCGGRIGGFADSINCDYGFVFPIPENLSSENAAPLLCAGHTVFTALTENAKPGQSVGVVGVGGLGHLAVQFAHGFGCVVTAISSSENKKSEAARFGARDFINTNYEFDFERHNNSLDLLLITTGKPQNWNALMQLLRPEGTMCFAGIPDPITVDISSLLSKKQRITTANIGGRKNMQEMLRFASRNNIAAITETYPMSEINNALTKLRRNEARYRIVLENSI